MSETRCSIRYEDYADHFVSRFVNLMQLQFLVDTTLMCNSHTLRVHKVVLLASSPYFQDILENRTGDLLIIMKMNFIVLKSLVEYMYSGKADLLEEHMPELISAARFLKIKGLSELKGEAYNNMAEFPAPLVFNQPYMTNQESSQVLEFEKLLQENLFTPSTTDQKNTNNVVLRIPIELKNTCSDIKPPGGRGRSRTQQHCFHKYDDLISMNKVTRKKSYSNKQESNSSSCGAKLLNKATRKVLRKEEKSSIQAIQHLKNLQEKHVEGFTEQLELSQAVDSIFSPGLTSEHQEYTVSDDQTIENMDAFQNQYDNQSWMLDNTSNLKTQDPNDVNSALSQYVGVLKSAGLPTDVPILFESEDGSYVNISGEVLLDMVQSNSIQYEVVEHSGVIKQIIQNGFTKSIDEISEEIGHGVDVSLDHGSEVTSFMEYADHTNDDVDKIDDCSISENLELCLSNNFNSINSE